MIEATFSIVAYFFVVLYIMLWMGHYIRGVRPHRKPPIEGTTARAFYDLNESIRDLGEAIWCAIAGGDDD